ncbi:MAG: DUF5821 family protein, partial [Candidatus Hydrothermarchaeaceae archaeon]
FVNLSKLFGEPRYQLLIRKVLDVESRILISAAKNGELYQNVMRWAADEDIAKRSTLSDRKQYLMELGIISEKTTEKTGKRGRPKKRLCMTEDNIKRFEELFGSNLR